MTTNIRRNIVELKEIREDVEDINELREKVNASIVELNYILRSLTLTNIDGEIKNVTIPANTTKRVSHRFGITPKYRIILSQSSGGLILDGKFTATYIELSNTGGSEATLSLIIVKD